MQFLFLVFSQFFFSFCTQSNKILRKKYLTKNFSDKKKILWLLLNAFGSYKDGGIYSKCQNTLIYEGRIVFCQHSVFRWKNNLLQVATHLLCTCLWCSCIQWSEIWKIQFERKITISMVVEAYAKIITKQYTKISVE